MFTIDTIGSFQPAIFTIGEGEVEGEFNLGVVPPVMTLDTFYRLAVDSTQRWNETEGLMGEYYGKLVEERNELKVNICEKEMLLAELQGRKERLDSLRDQLEKIIRGVDRKVVRTMDAEFRQTKLLQKKQAHRRLQENLLENIQQNNWKMQVEVRRAWRYKI